MKGTVKKFTDFFIGKRYYRIVYKLNDDYSKRIDIQEEDMFEFMDDIYSAWMKLALKKVVITEDEEEEQDRDEQEMTKTYDNPIQKDLEYFEKD